MNVGWREYGNRVGVYRLLQELEDAGLPAAFPINALVYEQCPGVAEAIRASGKHEVCLQYRDSVFIIAYCFVAA